MWCRLIVAAGLTAALAIAQAPAPKVASVGTTSFLGVNLQEIDSARAKTLKLPEEAGVEITRVAADSPAEKAGLKPGDVVMQYNGQRVEGMDQFSRLVHETPAGREVKLQIYRDGAPQTVTATIVSRSGLLNGAGQLLLPAPNQDPLSFHIPDLPRSLMTWRSAALGIEAEALSGQLAEYFGVKEGVLVRSVSKGSAAEKAGIQAGDVITKVDEIGVATPADISNHLRTQRGKAVTVVLMRDRKETTVTVTV
jgi:serine protease Do